MERSNPTEIMIYTYIYFYIYIHIKTTFLSFVAYYFLYMYIYILYGVTQIIVECTALTVFFFTYIAHIDCVCVCVIVDKTTVQPVENIWIWWLMNTWGIGYSLVGILMVVYGGPKIFSKNRDAVNPFLTVHSVETTGYLQTWDVWKISVLQTPPTRWCPPSYKLVYNPINYRYIYHKSKLLEL